MIQQQQTYFLELYRTGIRATSDMLRASLESAQRLQAQQADAMRTALEENARTSRELAEARSLDELVAVQVRILGGTMERSADLWSQMWRTASESQVNMIGQVQSSMGSMTDTARAAANNVSAATTGADKRHERKTA